MLRITGQPVGFHVLSALVALCSLVGAIGSQAADRVGRVDELPSEALDAVYRYYRFEGVTQREAEALFGSAVAAIYLPDRGEVRLVASDGLDTARSWLRDSPVLRKGEVPLLGAGFLTTDGKLVAVASVSLRSFVEEIDEQRSVKAADGGQVAFLAKIPSVNRASAGGRRGQMKALPIQRLGKDYWVFREDFEGDVWQLWSREDNTGGQYTWGVRSCDAHWSTYSADAVRGGSSGALLGCNASYPANVETRMFVESCQSMEPHWSAYLELMFKASMDQEGDDWFGVYFEDEHGDLYGWGFIGAWSEWYTLTFNLRQWWWLGDLGAQYCNTLSLWFEGDGSGSPGYGARVDDLEIWYGDYVGTSECSVIADPVSGQAPLTVALRATTDLIDPSFNWWFSDGDSGEGQELVRVFTTPGRYGISLRTYNEYEGLCYSAVTINVDQGSCMYAISPVSASVAHEGGSGNVSVTASPSNCNWSAVSNASWLTITEGGGGTGDGTVRYWVDANSTSSPRTGTLTIAGRTFTVTQSGTPSCSPPVITSHPASQTILSGSTASLSVSATGTSPLSYQWYRGERGNTNDPVAGARSATYTTPALTATTRYWVHVTNACGSAASSTATITVTCPAPSTPSGLQTSVSTVPSGTPYRVLWDSVEGAYSYDLQEAANPSFSDAVSHNDLIATSRSFSHTVSAATSYYYRVRARRSCGAASGWSGSVMVNVTASGGGTSFRYLVPGIASAPGFSGTYWRSFLSVCNLAGETASLTLI